MSVPLGHSPRTRASALLGVPVFTREREDKMTTIPILPWGPFDPNCITTLSFMPQPASSETKAPSTQATSSVDAQGHQLTL